MEPERQPVITVVRTAVVSAGRLPPCRPGESHETVVVELRCTCGTCADPTHYLELSQEDARFLVQAVGNTLEDRARAASAN